jgi:hypothetical protein
MGDEMTRKEYEIKILGKMKDVIGKHLSPSHFFPANEFPDKELLNAILLSYENTEIAKILSLGISNRPVGQSSTGLPVGE